MKGRWRIAKVTNNEIYTPTITDGPSRHVVQFGFRFIEPYRFNGKKVGRIFASFSDHPQALWRIKTLLDAVQVQGLDKLPDKRLNGRYCKIHIIQEKYNEMTRLHVRRFAPINEPLDLAPPVEPIEPEIEYTWEQKQRTEKELATNE